LADDAVASYAGRVGETIDLATVTDGVNALAVSAISKGKGFQGAVKRHNLTGNFATHGHKFTRVVGSMGNRKPRRTMK
jgi:large subunit ribosomal protein L3